MSSINSSFETIVPNQNLEGSTKNHQKDKALDVFENRQVCYLVSEIGLTGRVKIVLKPFDSVKATFIDSNGNEFEIKREDQPAELRTIPYENFFPYLSHAYPRITFKSNGDVGLAIYQRLNGGGKGKKRQNHHVAEDQELAQITMDLIQKGQEEISKKKIKPKLILMIGRTKSGKSTLVNLLANHTLVEKVGPNNATIYDAENPPMPIGHSGDSCTKIPGVFTPEDKDYTFVDCPGFGDTNGPFQNIANLFFRSEMTNRKEVEYIKVPIIIQYDDVLTGGTHLSNLFKELADFLTSLKDKHAYHSIKDSFCLFITKVNQSEIHTEKEILENALEETEQGLIKIVTEITKLQLAFQKLENLLKVVSEESKPDVISLMSQNQNDIKLNIEQKKLLTDKLELTKEKLAKLKLPSMVEEVKEALKNSINRIEGENGKKLLNYLVDNNRLAIFSRPNKVNFEKSIQRERLEIQGLLDQIKFAPKNDAKIETKVADQYFKEVRLSILSNTQSIVRKFSSEILTEMQKTLTHLLANSSREKIDKFLVKLRNIGNERSTLFDYVSSITQIMKSGQVIEEKAKRHDALLGFLISLLKEEDQNEDCSRLQNWMDKLGHTKQLKFWEQFLATVVRQDIQPEILRVKKSDGTEIKKLLLKGYFLKTSQITTKLAALGSFDEVEVRALREIIVDENLNDEQFSHILLSIIAPNWVIENERIISTSGKNGTLHPKHKSTNGANAPDGQGAKGEDGTAGAPGLPGQNGGYFLGIGDHFTNLKSLKIISNGGRGGNGQQGGDGGKGGLGRDGRYPPNKDVHDRLGGAHSYGGVPFNGKNHLLVPVYTDGQIGGKGGNGGEGGSGGIGGKAGAIDCLFFAPTENFQKEQVDGAIGTSGDSGAGTIGGVGGMNYHAVWDFNTNNYSGYNPPAPNGRADNGPVGVINANKNSINQIKPLEITYDAYGSLVNYKCFLIQNLSLLDMNFLTDFLKKIDEAIFERGTVLDYLNEAQSIEGVLLQTDAPQNCILLYQSLLNRVVNLSKKEKGTEELKVLQFLYTSILTRIFQIKASTDLKLITDIKGFIRISKSNIQELRALKREKVKEVCKNDYIHVIEKKIAEADEFIVKLKNLIDISTQKIDLAIERLQNEVKELIKNAQMNEIKLTQKKDELKNAMETKMVLGAITVGVQALGCLYPGVGTIIATAVSVGINLAFNPSTENITAGVGDIGTGVSQALAYQASEEAGLHVSQWANSANALASAGKGLAALQKQGVADNEKLKIFEEAIAEEKQLQEQLKKYEKNVTSRFKPVLDAYTNEIQKKQDALENKSLVALEFGRCEASLFLDKMKIQISQFTKGFAAEGEFLLIIREMEKALETSTNIYQYINEYRDQIALGNYIADMVETDLSIFINPVFKSQARQLKIRMQQNLILQHYYRSVAAFQQWAFPFAEVFLGDFASLQILFKTSLDGDEKLQAWIDEISERLNKLEQRITSYKKEVHAKYDQALVNAQFSHSDQFSPFYSWSIKENGFEILNLLKGRRISLKADVLNTPAGRTGVKFKQIGITLKSSDPRIQEELDKIRKNYRIRLYHTGNSYYKFADKIYRISSESPFNESFNLMYTFQTDDSGTKPKEYNEVYKKMTNGESMLSPYTDWGMELEPLDNESSFFEELKETRLLSGEENFFEALENANISVHLIGTGTYMDEKKMSVEQIEGLNLNKYYQEETIS